MKIKFYYTCIAAVILTINAFAASAKDYAADFFGIKAGGTALNSGAIQVGFSCREISYRLPTCNIGVRFPTSSTPA